MGGRIMFQLFYKKIFILFFLSSFISFTNSNPIVDTSRLYGVTLDNVANLSGIVTALNHHYKKMTARVVFDEWVAANYYTTPCSQIHNVGFIMGELLDSYYFSQYSYSQYVSRVNEYLSTLGNNVDIWEVGNEVNGEWLGNIDSVVAKVYAAYTMVKAQSRVTELTLYYNYNCWSKQKNEMFHWANTYLPSDMKTGLDYVLVSYYEDDCNNYQPDWKKVFDSLHVIFPNSKLGVGECGTTKTGSKASYISRYYRMNITNPKYVGGYFWWYYYEDCIPYTNALWDTLDNAIRNNTPLPVTMSSFSFNVFSDNVNLFWQTQLEINNAGFLIERKRSDENNWQETGFVKGNGTSTKKNNYSYSDKKLAKGEYQYRLKQVDYNGNFEYYNLSNDVIIKSPGNFFISQNYPNPSNPYSKIDFELAYDGFVSLIVYDALGREVKTILNEFKPSGYYSAIIDGTNLSSGVYFYKLSATGGSENFTDVKKMILVK